MSKTMPQSQRLFAKIACTWEKMERPVQRKRRTMTELHLSNGSSVVCIPAGQDGGGARGYGGKNGLLLYDKACFIPDDAYGSTLSIAEDNAKTILISTPGGKSGRFHQIWTDRGMYPEVECICA